MNKITIHTPFAGVRAISIDGIGGRYVIKTTGSVHTLSDNDTGVVLGISKRIGNLRTVLSYRLRDANPV